MKKTLIALSLAMLSCQAMALPVSPVTGTPPLEKAALVEPSEVLLPAAPAPEAFPANRLWKTVKSLQLGPQSGITKVLGPKKEVLWTRGFDDQKVALLSAEEHSQIFAALGVPDTQLASLSTLLMEKYSRLPHPATVALLGAIALEPALDKSDQRRIEEWLNSLLSVEQQDVVTRRQALLALALLPQPSDQTVATMVRVYETSHNNWETFPINQFVQYHAVDLWERGDSVEVRQRLQAVQSLYGPGIQEDLAQQEPPVPSVILETEAAAH